MRTAIFDIETFSLHANTGIPLCMVYKRFDTGDEPTVLRADQFPQWRKNRSNPEPLVRAMVKALVGTEDDPDSGFNIFVAHNGQRFDKAMIDTWALKFGLPVLLRFAKFIDPVILLRKHCRISRNSLDAAIDFFGIPHKKTPIEWDHWVRATIDGSTDSMDKIVEHCVADVIALESLYKILMRLVKNIDEKGSGF